MILRKSPLFKNPIAHEIVFIDTKYRRTIQNSFRFVLLSFMYHKGLYLRDILVLRKDLRYETVRNNLFLHSSNTRVINGKLASDICSILKVDINLLYAIAKEFKESVKYNSISFTNDAVVFFKGTPISFGS